MALLTKDFGFTSGATLPYTTEGGTWSASLGSFTTAAMPTDNASADTTGLTGCLELSITGKNRSATSYLQWAGTWEDLGISPGDTVTAVTVSRYWRCSAYTTGASSTVGGTSDGLYDSGGTPQATNTVAASTYTASGAYASKPDSALTVPSGLQASATSVQLRLYCTLATGSSTSAVNTLHQDFVEVAVTYTPAAYSGTSQPAAVTATLTADGTADGDAALSATATLAAAGTVSTGGGITAPALAFSDAKYTTTAGTLTSTSFTPQAGDIIVVKLIAEDSGVTFATPVGGGWTYTSRVSDTTASHVSTRIYTAPVTAGGTPQTVAETPSWGANSNGGMVVELWRGAQLAATPATCDTRGSGAPSATLATAQDNSVVSWCNGDWAAISGSSRTYNTTSATPTEDGYTTVSTRYTGYWAYQSAAAHGSQTLGLTAPAGQTWTLAGIEIQGTSGTGSFSGAASLSVIAALTATGTVSSGATLAATASLTAAGTTAGTAALAATVTLAADGTTGGGALSGSAALAAATTLTASGATAGAAALAVSTALTAAGTAGGTAARTVTVTLSAAGTVSSGAALTVTGVLTAAGTSSGGTPSSGAALPVAVTLTAAGVAAYSGGAAVAVTVTLTATGNAAASTGAILAVTAAVAAAGSGTGAAALSITAALAAAGIAALPPPFTVGVLTASDTGPGGTTSTAALNTLTASDARGGPG